MKIRSIPLRWLSIATILVLISTACSAIVSALGIYVWSNAETVSYEIASLYDTLNIALLAGLVIYILWLIVFLICTYRVVANSRDRFGEDQMPGPGWSVGYYFIPVMNLFKPYQAMSVCTALTFGDDPAGVKTSRLLGPWWTAWIVSGAIGVVSTRLFVQADYDRMSMFVWSEILGTASSVIALAAIALIGLIVTRIGKFQMGEWPTLAPEKETPPPGEPDAAL